MLKRDLGKRFSCHGCGCKYYDMNREEPRCPKCGANPTDDPTPDPRLAAMAKIKAESAGRGRGPADRRGVEFEADFDPDTFEDEDMAEASEDDEGLETEEEYQGESEEDDDF